MSKIKRLTCVVLLGCMLLPTIGCLGSDGRINFNVLHEAAAAMRNTLEAVRDAADTITYLKDTF